MSARFPLVLAAVFAVWTLALGLEVQSRTTWALENGLVLVLVVFLAATWRAFPLSRISYSMIFAFLCLHEVGAHYTYSLVPYDAFFERVFGGSLNAAMGWERNHFDRAIHLSYGLLLTYPIREVYLRVASARGFWGYFLPLDLAMSTSMIYELIEWGAAAVFGSDVGMEYLGTQGDVWDAHKDMALATLGSVIAMSATLAVNLGLQRDFAAEWAESLRVKSSKPLGETRIQEMLEQGAED